MMTDRYTRLTEAIQTTKKNTTAGSCITSKHYQRSHSSPYKLLIYHGSQFVSRFSAVVCITLEVHNITTTEYPLPKVSA